MQLANIFFLTKEEMLVLTELAGEMSMADYTTKVIREHIASQQAAAADGQSTLVCGGCFKSPCECLLKYARR